MSDGFTSIDIIIFAAVAAFFAIKLRSVLGRRTGNERQPPHAEERDGESGDNVVSLPKRRQPPPLDLRDGDGEAGDAPREARDGVAQVRARDPRFEVEDFAAGAQTAFGMVVEAFAAGDKQALRPLLADSVYANFTAAIDARAAEGRRLQTELISIDEASVVGAEMAGDMARVTVRFKSEQINIVRDGSGKVVEGDPSRPEIVIDVWTFERDVRSPDPNWALVETNVGS